MRRLAIRSALLLALTAASSATAGTSPPGVNLSWDQCFADGGTRNKNFACDVNTGADVMVASFEVGAPLAGVTGIEAVLQVKAESAVLPTWWSFSAPGGVLGCRGAGLTVNLLPPAGMTNCEDWSQGTAQGGLATYQPGYNGDNSRKIILGAAVPLAIDLQPGIEYFLARIQLAHTRTVGTGACAGCATPACLYFDYANIIPGVLPLTRLAQGANWSGSPMVTYQSGYVTNLFHEITPGAPGADNHHFFYDCVLASPTSARGSTWGQVKSLYR